MNWNKSLPAVAMNGRWIILYNYRMFVSGRRTGTRKGWHLSSSVNQRKPWTQTRSDQTRWKDRSANGPEWWSYISWCLHPHELIPSVKNSSCEQVKRDVSGKVERNHLSYLFIFCLRRNRCVLCWSRALNSPTFHLCGNISFLVVHNSLTLSYIKVAVNLNFYCDRPSLQCGGETVGRRCGGGGDGRSPVGSVGSTRGTVSKQRWFIGPGVNQLKDKCNGWTANINLLGASTSATGNWLMAAVSMQTSNRYNRTTSSSITDKNNNLFEWTVPRVRWGLEFRALTNRITRIPTTVMKCATSLDKCGQKYKDMAPS